MKEKLNKLKETLKIVRLYGHALGIINFDYETIAPKDSREDEANVINYFSNEVFKLTHTDEFKQLIVDLYNGLDQIEDPLDVKLIKNLYEGYEKSKNMTPEFDLKRNQILSEAYMVWLEAKEKKDYQIFKPSLMKVRDVMRESINLRDHHRDNLYDDLLDEFEKGMLQKDLDPFFDELKAGLIDLLNRIKHSKHVIRRDFLSRKVPVYKQAEFSDYLLKLNGYDFNRGVLATTEHPFTSNVARYDSRVTTHYHEDMVLSNIFSVIHEGGHAIFMQNERPEDFDHFINDEITSGMHESVSRFYENVIGRSKEYIHLIYPKFMELFKEEFSDVSEQELYEAVNIVEPSLIRTEADEVTYALHIIIRYEMEKLLASNAIDMDKVPEMWNKLYKEYLGVDVPDDSQGVLQDVHWTFSLGYFPSYALGNAYNAMYLERMKRELPFDDLVKNGDFETIKKWMKENVFIHANVLDPKDWIKEITGNELSPRPFLDYLNKKYKDIYKL